MGLRVGLDLVEHRRAYYPSQGSNSNFADVPTECRQISVHVHHNYVLLDKLTVAQLLRKFPALITLPHQDMTARCYDIVTTWSLDIPAVFGHVVNKVVCRGFNGTNRRTEI
jgi:hypothetical protein